MTSKTADLQLFSKLFTDASEVFGNDPKELQWNDFQKFAKDSNISFDYRQMIKQLGGFANVKTVLFGPAVYAEALKVKAAAKKIKKQTTDQKIAEIISDKLTSTVDSVFGGGTYSLPKLPKREKFLERHQHLMISDTHFGSDLDPDTGIRKYGAEEESRSMARIVTGTLDFKTNYRKNTKLYVNILGDIIQGKIHDVESSAKAAVQMCRAIYVLGRSLHILASEFPEIEVNCATGNHDRIPYTHPDRATSDKYNSYSTVIYYAVKQQLRHIPNIKFNITKAPFYSYTSFNEGYWCTHGDNQIKVPNPMGVINVSNLENEINKINARKNVEKYSVFMVGHIHTAMKIAMKNGTTLITNPPLIPTDGYALSLNIDPDAPTGQQLFESVEGYPCGDLRTLWVTEEDRKNQSLDKIIEPFKSL
jgi:hypothetical protein